MNSSTKNSKCLLEGGSANFRKIQEVIHEFIRETYLTDIEIIKEIK